MKTFANPLRLLTAAVLLIVCLCAVAFSSSPLESCTWLSLAGLGGLGAFLLKDKLLRTVHALPNGANTTNGAGLDLGLTSRSEFVANSEAVVSAPALTTTELGDTQTVTYHLYHDTAVGFGSETLLATLGLQTGAGGAGAAAAEFRLKLPSTVKRYLRLKTVKVGASNASTASATLELAF